MSADLLKRAAAKLREHAEKATPGPWEHVDHGPPTGTFMGCGSIVTMGEGVEGGDIAAPSGDCYPRGGYSPLEDMSFIALMHPPVALALAEWLESAAKDALGHDHPEDWVDGWHKAIATARAILREAHDG